LERQIVSTSLAAGVLSRFTAFLVIDEESPRFQGPPSRSVAQPVEAPAGWGAPAHRPSRRPRPADRSSSTRAGTVRGGLTYLAPEQARGFGTDARTDVHALGLLLYLLLTGEHPFRRGTDIETLSAIVGEEAPPLLGVDAALAALVARALAKNPADRFADAAAFDAALAAIVAALGAASAPPSPAELEALLEALSPGSRLRSDDALRRASAAAPPGQPGLAVELGRGGSAEAWLVRRLDEGSDRALVVRTLVPHLAEDVELQEAFLDEASFEHPNIVRVLETGTTSSGLAYVASEYVAGVTLQAFVRGLRLRKQGLGASPVAFAIVRQVAAALSFVHSLRGASGNALGWHHGRLRPADVLIGFDGVVKVKGFGPAPSPEFAPVSASAPLPFFPAPSAASDLAPSPPSPSAGGAAPSLASRPPSPSVGGAAPSVVSSPPSPSAGGAAPSPSASGRYRSEAKVMINVPTTPEAPVATSSPRAEAAAAGAGLAPEPAPEPAPSGFFQTLRRKFWGARPS
ncbi:MAG TPA: hypothetical protein VFS00_10210, partial [Polyangiaceae bacterium]|nr:hypothetical protein [Polyangiaceae bacterium]